MVDPIKRDIDSPLSDLDDILAVHCHAQGFLAQAFSVALGAGIERDVGSDLGSDPLRIGILVAPHHVADHALEGGAECAAPS